MLEVLLPFLFMKQNEDAAGLEVADNNPLNQTVATDCDGANTSLMGSTDQASRQMSAAARSIEAFSNQMRQIPKKQSKDHGKFDLACVYAFFKRFVKSFIPNNLHNKFNGRQNELPYLSCCLRITDLLLNYTDKEMAAHLERKHIQIEMYAPRMVTTLYSRVVELSLLYELWEIFLFERDKFFIFYFAVGMLIGFKEDIMRLQTMESLIVFL